MPELAPHAPEYIPVIVILMVFALPLGWFILTFVVATFEVYYAWPYAPAEDLNAYPAAPNRGSEQVNPYAVQALVPEDRLLNQYGVLTCEQATAHGFLHLGVWRDTRGGLCSVRYDFLVNPHANVFAVIGCGSIAKIPLNATWLFTMLENDKCVLSIDNQAGTHHDLTDLTMERVYPRETFSRLLELHLGRIKNNSFTIRPFSPVNPLNDLKAFRMRRAELLVEQNYARFRDPARMTWRYSLWGAFLVTVTMYWRQLRPKKD